MTREERIEAALATVGKATDGPWSLYHEMVSKRLFLQIDIGAVPIGRNPCIVNDAGFDSCDLPQTTKIANATLLRASPDLRDEVIALRAQVERQKKAIEAISALINDSQGVYGLHLNGDPAPWEELRTGGRYEDWLIDFDVALSQIESEEEGRG